MSTNRHDPPTVNSGFFNHASNTTIHGGNFIYNNWADDSNKYLNLLYKRVAVNAILNAGGRADPVRCFPGTREEVLARIQRWLTDGYRSDRRPFWLSGPAGAGKSAIVQTIAEYCLHRGIPMANFFFFRSDGTRNHAQPIASTVAYQLFDFDASLKDHVHTIIQRDPPVISKSIQAQFYALVDIPVRQSASLMQPERPIILLVDGLDECGPKEDQAVLLDVLYNLVTAPDSPFIALVASRTEHQITKSFNRLGSFPDSIFLDDTFRPDADIRRYLEAQFVDIKRTHTLRQLLAPEWPSEDAITHLVKKSSGQFIYAATVARFVSDSPSCPKESLERLLSHALIGSYTPFAPLDDLYTHILSQVHDLHSVLEILAARTILIDWSRISFRNTLDRMGYPSEVIISRLSDLSALVKIADRGTDDNDDDIFVFYHASFSDFLVDEGRSKGYHPDFSTIASRIMLLFCLPILGSSVYINKSTLMFTKWVEERNVYLDDALSNGRPRGTSVLYESTVAASTLFLDKLNVLYQEGDPVFHQFLLERWAVIWITLDIDIGHHEKILSLRTRLDLKLQVWLRKWDNDRWQWYALLALDRRYEHLRLQHSVE